MFERPSNTPCPKCGKQTFKIVLICGNKYFKRCSECKTPAISFDLPEVKKKIIYLDQFIYSNFAKLSTKEEFTRRSYFNNFRKRILKLYYLQAILCPYSDSHDDESSLSPLYNDIKKQYESFSSNVRFNSYHDIQLAQLLDLSTIWLKGDKNKRMHYDEHDVFNGNINCWIDNFRVSINRTYPKEWIDTDGSAKLSLQKKIDELYSKYSNYPRDPFNECYDDEKKAYGIGTVTVFLEYYRGNKEFNNDLDLTPPDPVLIITDLNKHFLSEGFSELESLKLVFNFLLSDAVSNLSFVKIPALIYGSIARKIYNGMKKPIDAGTPEDAKIISHLIPYCDAMFIDKTMHSILLENPVKEHMKFPTKLFSLNNQEDFFTYLDDIEKGLQKEQLELAKMLYNL